MPFFPLRYDESDKKDAKLVELTEVEEKRRERHYTMVKAGKEYRDKNKNEWTNSMSLFNLTNLDTNDQISNFYLGTARTFIDQFISMTTKSPPGFDFDPGRNDHKLATIYKSLVDHVLSECDASLHMRRMMTDATVIGTGALHPFVRRPQRMDRWETESGSIEEKVIVDLRRAKVGIEHVHPLSCWRSPYDTSMNDVTGGGQEIIYSRLQFIQEFANNYLPNGKPKYDKMDEVLASDGTHVKVSIVYHDVLNEYAIYALPFGSAEEDENPDVPELELGIPILYKPLKRRRFTGKSGEEIVSGHNVLGTVPLVYFGFADRYDEGGTNFSLYPMGLAKMIEQPEAVFNAFTNMTIENMKLANTVLLSYKSYDGKSYPDLDVGAYYSGGFIDGQVETHPLGISRIGENQAMFEFIRKVFVDLTGVNPAINSDDPASTAFEMAQKIKSNNNRAEYRLSGMEVGMRKLGHSLLANCLSELTVPEWVDVTEEEAKNIASLIQQGAMTADDFNPNKKQKRVLYSFPVKGKKYREDFKQTKTRQLNYQSDKNTLIEDKGMGGEDSYIVAAKEYLIPTGDISAVMKYGVKVEMSRMLGDRKAHDVEMYSRAIEQAITTQQPKDVIDNLFKELLEFMQVNTSKIFGDASGQSEAMLKAQAALKNVTSLLQNAGQNPPMAGAGQAPQAPQANAPQLPAGSSSQNTASHALAKYASGTL